MIPKPNMKSNAATISLVDEYAEANAKIIPKKKMMITKIVPNIFFKLIINIITCILYKKLCCFLSLSLNKKWTY